jgi:hypothetical protein
MSKTETISQTTTGSVKAFEESDTERAERLELAGRAAASKLRLTSGQRRVLANVQERARRAS